MPSLSFSEATLRRHINKFIKEGLLKREIKKEANSLPRAFYRVTGRFLKKTPQNYIQFEGVYNNIEALIWEGRIMAGEKNKLISLLSSYSGKKKKNTTTYNLSEVKGTAILDYLNEQFSLSLKGEGVKMNVWVEINLEWVKAEIIQPILNKGKLNWWIEVNANWEYEPNDLTKNKILSKLQTMFEWAIENKKEIKSMRGRINTFFGKNYI